ncbi:hypothetical protein BH09ACT6_BH09ACT6_25470 [soil metagenome]
MKKTGDAVERIVSDDSKGVFDNASFIGTLANGGVDIAPFHDLAASVPPALATEIDALRADIVAGTLVVSSPSQPK